MKRIFGCWNQERPFSRNWQIIDFSMDLSCVRKETTVGATRLQPTQPLEISFTWDMSPLHIYTNTSSSDSTLWTAAPQGESYAKTGLAETNNSFSANIQTHTWQQVNYKMEGQEKNHITNTWKRRYKNHNLVPDFGLIFQKSILQRVTKRPITMTTHREGSWSADSPLRLAIHSSAFESHNNLVHQAKTSQVKTVSTNLGASQFIVITSSVCVCMHVCVCVCVCTRYQ